MRIERVDPGTDAVPLGCSYRILADSDRLDDPDMPVQSLQRFAQWASGYDDPRQLWLATDDAGQPVGCYALTLPAHANPALASCLLAVAPSRRRTGAGTLLLEHCARQARQAGRSRLAGSAKDGSPGAAFAAAAGAISGIALVVRQLAVDSSLRARLADLRAAAGRHAGGYSLLSWLGVTPEERLGDSARLSAALADAPADAGVEPDVWDAGRIRYMERAVIDGGRQIYSIAARHDQTGRIVAQTQILTDPDTPGWARQWLTAVLPEHRGHRLGLLIKIEMLELLARRAPDVHHIVARNAGANAHMIAINDQLGFKVSSVRRDWELALPPGSQGVSSRRVR